MSREWLMLAALVLSNGLVFMVGYIVGRDRGAWNLSPGFLDGRFATPSKPGE